MDRLTPLETLVNLLVVDNPGGMPFIGGRTV